MPNEDTLYSAKHWALKSKEYAEQASVNNSTITITQGGTTKGSFTLNQATDETIEIDAGGNQKTFDLFDHKWSDHLLNDMAWLRADTFSWQDGTVYTEAYQHLADDYANGTDVTETIGSYTITYRLAPDGHKIVFYNQSSVVNNIYNETGVAWYYMYDPNQARARFKLPRTKYGFVGLRDTVGNYVPESLPNVKGQANQDGINDNTTNGFVAWGTNSGPFYAGSTNPTTAKYTAAGGLKATAKLGFDASRASSTYQDDAPVQERATQMYLYFYVGQFSQTATEQTAGLNTELFNGKVDLNAANLSTAGKSLISGLGMPSDNYDNLTLGASGSTYTAPANGYFFINRSGATAGSYLNIINTTTNFGSESYAAATNNKVMCWLPVKSGDVVSISYSVNYTTTNYFRFIYAEGEPNV